jgi:type IV pilus assembly protein PilC
MAQTLFFYRALDADGNEKTGGIKASTELEAVVKLQAESLYVKKIDPLVDPRFRIRKKKKPKSHPFLAWSSKSQKVSSKTMMIFIRQMASLLDAGLPILRSLKLLQSQQDEGKFHDVLGDLCSSIQSGESFSDAAAHHPEIFNRLFVKMVKAGELGGVLNIVLNRLAEFTEKTQKIKGKVKSALMYPCIVLFIAITIVSGLLVFIVPKFEKIFFDMLGGRPLPFLTRMVIDTSNGLKDHFIVILGTLGIGYFIATELMKKPRVQRVVDKWIFWMPLFGELVRMSTMARFARTLSTLLSSGVPILQALNNARETAGNTVVADAIAKIYVCVKEGETIRQAMLTSEIFPIMVVGMVEVGEETGMLPEMLAKIAELYEEEVDTTVAGLTSLMEPIMIVLLALLIGTIVIALFLPLIGIMSGLQS